MSENDIDVEAALAKLAAMREHIPQAARDRAAARRRPSAAITIPPGVEQSTELFEMLTLIEAYQSFAEEWAAVEELLEELTQEDDDEWENAEEWPDPNEPPVPIEEVWKKVVEVTLNFYYTLEEAILDGEHDDLIPIAEEMRETHRRQFGEEIPPRK
jgi:hypothetical protein